MSMRSKATKKMIFLANICFSIWAPVSTIDS